MRAVEKEKLYAEKARLANDGEKEKVTTEHTRLE